MVAFSASAFMVNLYFENEHAEQMQLWQAEQKQKEAANLLPQVMTTSPGAQREPPIQEKEQFYLLENSYQQLVFSTRGGALAEINLPFQGERYPLSVVKEIGFDRAILEQHPANARFPLHPHFTAAETPGSSPQLVQEGALGGYYPLLRRDLIGLDGTVAHKVPAQFYACNLVSEYPELSELIYQVVEFTKDTIVFQAKQGFRTITKRFTLPQSTEAAPYCIECALQIDGESRGLWLTSGIPEVEWISGGPAPVLKYRITRYGKPEVENLDLPPTFISISSLNPDWLCNSNGFFGLILDPIADAGPGLKAQAISGAQVPSRLTLIDEAYQVYPAEKMAGYTTLLPLKAGGGTSKLRLFSGPFATPVLKAADQAYTDPKTGDNPDYLACQTFHGWFAFISQPFAKVLFWLLQFFYWITSSWAFSIILLTAALRLMLYPLNAWSIQSTIKMQQIAPMVRAIQDKHKKEPQKAQAEMLQLYRDKGVNPLSGCLPLLIQMPFLIGMFDLLKSSFELRGAGFIPGWIDDLSAPDVLFRWQMPLPLIGNAFHLLPFLLGATMFLQQRMMAPAQVGAMTDQQRQQRAMGNVMAAVFTFMFYSFPSGLNIYWLSSMLLGMAQQYWMAGRIKPLQHKR